MEEIVIRYFFAAVIFVMAHFMGYFPFSWDFNRIAHNLFVPYCQMPARDSVVFMAQPPQFSVFTDIGMAHTYTRDPIPHAVIVEMLIGYDLNDEAPEAELTERIAELQDFVRSFFREKYAWELRPENEAQLRREIIERLNTQILRASRVRHIFFGQLEAMEA
jgi:flagellar basal body-associated protein FliL